MARFDLMSQEFKRNPWPLLAEMRAAGPMVEMTFPIVGRAYLATTWNAVADFLKGGDKFAADGRNAGKTSSLGFWWAPKAMRILGQNMLTLDDPDHRRLRKLVDAPFRRDRIDAMRPAIARLADQLLDEMEASGDMDLARRFARQLPLRVISEMLGLPDEHRIRVTQWMSDFSDVRGPVTIARAFGVIGKMMNYLREEFVLRRADPRPGLVTELVQAEAEGERLSEDELLAMVFVLFIAGHETTTHVITTSVLDLLQHPDQLDLLKAEPGLMPNAVEELHRRNSPVQATKPRMAREDMDFHGVRLKRGERVMGFLAAANADPDHFPDPEKLDLRRENVRHAGYGGGMHLCLGMHLARVETEVALERILARWPNLGLAVPASQLRWLMRPGMRGPLALPLLRDCESRESRAA
jgi:cytochrome P450